MRVISEKRRAYLREYQKRFIAQRRQAWLIENGPCRQCGSKENLEVDHIDPKQKITHTLWSWSESKRRQELDKCQVLCKKCHREKTNEYIHEHFCGRPSPSRLLSPETVVHIRSSAKNQESHRAIARRLNISRFTVDRIVSGRYYAWV